jgi:hypothetical protein
MRIKIIWFVGSFAIAMAIAAVIRFKISEPEPLLNLRTTVKSNHFIANEEELQKAMKMANEGDLKSASKVATWYHMRSNHAEANRWEQRCDEIRIKRGLPTKAELFKDGLPGVPRK